MCNECEIFHTTLAPPTSRSKYFENAKPHLTGAEYAIAQVFLTPLLASEPQRHLEAYAGDLVRIGAGSV